MSSVENIFDFLDENYIPEKLPFRESQILFIKDKIEKYSKNFKPTYLLIFGSSGLGKTASVKYVFKNFQILGVKYVYLNAFVYNTSSLLLSKIAEELKILEIRGVSKEEILERIVNYLKNSNLKIVICIDEIDKVKDINEILYIFSRMTFLYNYYPYLILISNNKDFILNLDQRVLSSLNFDELEFKQYTFEQLKTIAEERVKLIFQNNYDKAAITLIANLAYNYNSDVRIILKVLKKALEILLEKNENKLSIEIIKEVIKKFEKKKIDTLDEKIKLINDERQKEIINLLKEKEMTTTELFEIINKKFNIKRRMFNYLLKDLVNKNIIEIKRVNGIKGSKFVAKLIL
ncbi:MAG: orc1/cdc6 family replication initiation protein [Candidatus Aenigmatarchaeota archaeon]